MSGGAIVSPKEGSHREKITVLHRFHFTSALKRMAVTVKVSSLPCMLCICYLPPLCQPCSPASDSMSRRAAQPCQADEGALPSWLCHSWRLSGFHGGVGCAAACNLQGLLMPASSEATLLHLNQNRYRYSHQDQSLAK